jgi:hypothetical protein
VGITRARGRVYKRRGATVVPTFHPAAALRGGRFGGLNPVDAIREDLQVVKHLLARAASQPAPPPAPPPAVTRSGEMESAQLGLF